MTELNREAQCILEWNRKLMENSMVTCETSAPAVILESHQYHQKESLQVKALYKACGKLSS